MSHQEFEVLFGVPPLYPATEGVEICRSLKTVQPALTGTYSVNTIY